jgi:hypothetical protein
MTSLRKLRVSSVAALAALVVVSTGVLLPVAVGQEAPSAEAGPLMETARPQPQPAEGQAAQDGPQAADPSAQPKEPPAPVPVYDKAIFQRPIPSDQLEFLKQFDGAPSNAVYRDKQFHRLLHGAIVPGWMFHYGRDMSLPDALDMVMQGSAVPVEIRDGRYVTIGGAQGPYLLGRGMVWIDMQDGLALGAFYFHPTNGEPTPSLTVFSKQIGEDALSMDRLPPEFGVDLRRWQTEANVPLLSTRYFIGDVKERILLEHDEDFCGYLDGPNALPPDDCEQMVADAADVDMNTAYYLDQVHYATNATAWMIVGQDETAFLAFRDRSCGGLADPLGCRIRVTREQVHRVVFRGPGRRR